MQSPNMITSYLLVAVAFLVLLALAGCRSFRYEHDAMTLGKHRYPGTFVDVGGYRLFFSCTAPAPYTVLLLPGGGGTALMVKPVQDRLASDVIQVCSYDREGHGWSEAAPGPYRIEDEIEALHTALTRLPIGERLILVGPSYGGFVARLYAHRYPETLAGLVYVDPNSVYFFDKHPEVAEAMATARVPWTMKLAPSGLVRRIARKRLRRRYPMLDANDASALAHQLTATTHLQATVRYGRAFPATLATLRNIPNPSDIRTVVITRGQRDTDEPWTTEAHEQNWRAGHQTLLDGTEGLHVVAAGSGHAIAFEQPDLIVAVVRTVVQEDQGRQHAPAALSR